MVAITQMDLKPGYTLDQEVSLDVPVIPISAVTGYQLDHLKEEIWQMKQTNEANEL